LADSPILTAGKSSAANTVKRKRRNNRVMVKGVANIWMPVQAIDRAVDFYEDVLGLPVVKRDGPWAELDANGVAVGLNGRKPEGAGADGGRS
jgi:catechol-2,3-dioxygenase